MTSADATLQLPPLKMHATKPSRCDYAYALCDEIHAAAGTHIPGTVSEPFRYAVEELGYIAASVASPERNNALRGLRMVRKAQLRG